jgi:hypothetical protein
VRLRGIQLGRPVDMLLDVEAWHALGFVVLCGDESQRFLPFAASQPGDEEIAVGSALMLLEDVAFYADRGASFRSLLDGEVEGGTLRDVEIDATGTATTLEIERDGEILTIPAAGALVVPTRQAA